jgi:hypothetical protein
MASESRQLRGWKEIAAHLGTSERTVKRWESSRQLPIHRVGGRGRDAVFARADELDSWLGSSGSGSPGMVSTTEPGGPPSVQAVGTHGRWPILRTRFLAFALIAGGLPLGWAVSQTWRGRPVEEAGPRVSHSLRLTVKDWTTTIGVRDGECARVELKKGLPLDFCPAVDPRGLVVRVKHAGGGTLSPARVLTLRLQRNAEVRVMRPVAFELEWTGDESAPGSAGPQ